MSMLNDYVKDVRLYELEADDGEGDAEQQLGEVRRTLLAMEPNLVFLDSQTMATQVEATLLPVRAGAWLVGALDKSHLAQLRRRRKAPEPVNLSE